MRIEILEQDEVRLHAEMEDAVSFLKQNKGGKECDFDVVKGLEKLKENGFYTPGIARVVTISFTGPVFYYSDYRKKIVRGNHHAVGLILPASGDKEIDMNLGWVVDLAGSAGHKVFGRGINGYIRESGIRLPSDCQFRIY